VTGIDAYDRPYRSGEPYGHILGLNVIESVACVLRKQFRFPRSRRRRIRNKWARQDSNCRILPDPNVYVMKQQGTMVGHPATIAHLRMAAAK